ncbi:AraC family transcriptional regulator [Francisella sciaenopsi]|uniref:Helix-turn-helix transcriptional regulator n=1 Tax=Francisella sciaenopsi TaxID=3055034 RepID=A0ABQ6PGY7_9GAMM
MMKNGQNDLGEDINFCGEWRNGPSIVAIKADNSQYETQTVRWYKPYRGQIVCIETGVIHVMTEYGSWILPSNRAAWIPPNMPFRIRTNGLVRGWTVFILPELCEGLSKTPCVIHISEVLRALSLRATEWDRRDSLTIEQESIASIICNEIIMAPEESLHMPMPKTQRVIKVANAIMDSPSIDKSLEEWASFGAMSPRTLRRAFLSETGLTFSRWRQQAQLAKGLDMLAQDISVSEISDYLGYASPSNFIAMFRRAFGETPKQYFSNKKIKIKRYYKN